MSGPLCSAPSRPAALTLAQPTIIVRFVCWEDLQLGQSPVRLHQLTTALARRLDDHPIDWILTTDAWLNLHLSTTGTGLQDVVEYLGQAITQRDAEGSRAVLTHIEQSIAR